MALAANRVGSSTLRSRLTLYGPGGSGLTSNFDAGPGLNAYISNYEVSSDGTYYVVVDQISGIGNYQLRVERRSGIDLESDASTPTIRLPVPIR